MMQSKKRIHIPLIPVVFSILFTVIFISVDTKAYSVTYANIKTGVYMIQSGQNSNYVLDVHGNSIKNCANIEIYKKVGSLNQLFGIQYVKTINGIRYYRFINPYSLKVFDVEGGSRQVGANCIQYNWTGDDNQLWCFESAGSGYYYIKSKVGLYLDNSNGTVRNGNNVLLWSKNSNSSYNQKWKLIRMGNNSLGSMICRELREIGTAEHGNNNVKYNEWYYGTSWFAKRKYGPWCAVFQSWCAYTCGISTNVIYKGCLCSDLAKKYNQSGRYYRSARYGGNYKPKIGDMVFCSSKKMSGFSNITHMAFIVNIDENGNIWTIDGNAQDKDGVFKVLLKQRHLSDDYIVGYASITYE